jgi:ABC-2 type transport system permease protein
VSWLRIRAVARRHAYVLQRSPHRLFDVTIWPLVDVLLFGSLAVFVGRGGTSPGRVASGYLLSGILLWQVVYQSQISVATGFLEETWSRQLMNLMVTPLAEFEYVAGVALFGLLKLAMGVTLVALVAIAAFSFNITSLGLGLIPITSVLLLVGWVIALLVCGLVLRFGSGAEALAWGVMFVVMPISGVFYPIDALPAVLRPLAKVLPTTHAFSAARALADRRGVLWGQVVVAAIGALVGAVLALAFVARMLAVFRRRGYVTRYS